MRYPNRPVSSLVPLAAIAALSFAASAAAEPVTYVLDPDHTFPSLSFDHMGLSTWRGKFERSTGTVVLDRAAKTGTVDVKIEPASLDFGLASMHEHAAKADWLDFAKFPEARYVGTIAFEGEVPKSVDGKLTFRGITKPVKLAIVRFSCIPHPMTKKEYCGADAAGSVLWSDYGMKRYGEPGSDQVKLQIQAEGTRQD